MTHVLVWMVLGNVVVVGVTGMTMVLLNWEMRSTFLVTALTQPWIYLYAERRYRKKTSRKN